MGCLWPGTCANIHKAQTVAPNCRTFVEVNENGHWTRYRGDDIPESSDTAVPTFNAPQHDDESHEAATSMIPESGAPFSQHLWTPYQENATVLVPMALDIPPSDNSGELESISPSRSWCNFNTSGISPRPLLDWPNLIEESTSFDFNIEGQSRSPRIVQAGIQDCDDPSSASTNYSHSNIRDTTNASYLSSLEASTDLQAALALVLQGKSNTPGFRSSAGAFEIRDLADRFTSLLSNTSIFWGTRQSNLLVHPRSVADPVPFNTLLYSIINGFAGLEGVPPAVVLGVLRENREFFSHISKLLQAGPDTVAKPIVDNLLPAAIKAGDAEAVALLLQATRNHSGISIDLNKSVFHAFGKVYTPLELAVESGSTDVVRLMLDAGADPNRKIANGRFCKALSLAITVKNCQSDYPVLGMVRVLLDRDAEIDAESIMRAVGVARNNLLVIQELVQRLPASKHAICFSRPTGGLFINWVGKMHIGGLYSTYQALVEHMVGRFDATVVTSLVKNLVGQCMSTNCRKCIFDNPEVIDSMVLQAASRGNLELVTFLAQYTTSLHPALAGAVRSGNSELIDFLLNHGARADGPAVYVTNKSGSSEPSTPLAEAIRQEDEQLVHTLADYGAWRHLDNRVHWEAAILAAAEVEDVRYLKAVLRRNTPAEWPRSNPLRKALERGNTECALVLLRAGATIIEENMHIDRLLSPALQTRNKDVVNALLDCGVAFNNHPQLGNMSAGGGLCTMEIAGQWGDMEIIDALVSMGADLDAGLHTTALAAAVASKNRILVDHILGLGANPGAKALRGLSPLGEAVKNKDHWMIDHLLSKDATPADTSAFLAAMEYDRVALGKLSLAFKKKYPSGLKRFGGELIAQAIRANNAVDVSFWLDLKIDPASMVKADLLYPDNKHGAYPRQLRVTPLGFAIPVAKDGDTRVVDLLLRSGVSPDAIAGEYLHRLDGKSCSFFTYPLLMAITAQNSTMVNLLLKHGANINHPACRGVFYTPLQRACEMGSYGLVELLLQEGANVNSPAAGKRGGTALQFAAKAGTLKIVELLLLSKADPHAPGSEFGHGGTAFEMAAESGRYHVLLLLWNSAPRDGFTDGVLRSARDRAGRNGHRGCVDFITNIMHDASFGRTISVGG